MDPAQIIMHDVGVFLEGHDYFYEVVHDILFDDVSSLVIRYEFKGNKFVVCECIINNGNMFFDISNYVDVICLADPDCYDIILKYLDDIRDLKLRFYDFLFHDV